MHPEMARLLARERQEELLGRARREQLAATARSGRGEADDRGGSGRDWRAAVGSAVIDLGLWLAGGRIEAV